MALIAIVEDEFIVALNIQRTLEHAGHECMGIYQAGADFLAACELGLPDLALLDIHIKGTHDGLDIAALLLEKWQVPVIFLTAYADELTIAKAKETQPFGYLLKPFNERELLSSLEIALYRAEMQRKLLDSERRYRTLFEKGPSAKFLLGKDMAFVERNNLFESMLGRPTALSDVITDRAAFDACMTEIRETGKIEGLETAFRNQEGTPIPVYVNINPIPSRDGSVSMLYGEAIDISERKMLEQKLALSAKMEALGRLAGGIAHDFNNILTAIMGYAHLIINESDVKESVKGYAVGVNRSSKRAADLTKQLLAFSRNREAVPEAVGMNALCAEEEGMLMRLLPEKISFKASLEAADDCIFVDQAQFGQVLLNLVVNARDAMPSGGTISISTRNERIDTVLEGRMGSLPPGYYCVLSVDDTGQGIDPADMPRIFEPFFTTKGQASGTGLGLATVYGIVKSSHGMIDIQSVVDEGTVFSIYFPVWMDVESGGKGNRDGEVLKQCSGNIAVLEDDDDIRELIVKILGARGYEVMATGDPEEIIRHAASRNPIDLLLSDIMLPSSDGFEIATRFQDMRPDVPVLFMSGYIGKEPPKRWANTRILTKPFDEHTLLERIIGALRIQGAHKSRRP